MSNNLELGMFYKNDSPNKSDKRFVEIHTKEKLIINQIGAFAAPANSEKFMPLNNF